jgi:ribosome-binding factor A
MSIRTEKVASVIKKALAKAITDMAYEANAGLATLTSVKVTNDLQIAKLYISVYGGKITPLEFIEFLELRSGELRSVIASNVRLRFVPEIRIFLDDTLDQIDRIQKLLDSVDKKDDETSTEDNNSLT